MLKLTAFCLYSTLLLLLSSHSLPAQNNTLPPAPELIAPVNGSFLSETNPVFFWTSVTGSADNPVIYKLSIYTILNDQSASDAISTANLFFQAGTPRAFFQYDGPPLLATQQYAWRIQATDRQGRPVTLNNGYSEIFTFSAPAAASQAGKITTGRIAMTGFRTHGKTITTNSIVMTGFRTHGMVVTPRIAMTGMRTAGKPITTGRISMTGITFDGDQPVAAELTTALSDFIVLAGLNKKQGASEKLDQAFSIINNFKQQTPNTVLREISHSLLELQSAYAKYTSQAMAGKQTADLQKELGDIIHSSGILIDTINTSLGRTSNSINHK